MEDFKNRLYNYETTPPEGVWEAIASQLDENEVKVIPITRKKNNRFYYLAAASIAVILFCFIFFFNRSSISENKRIANNTHIQGDTAGNDKFIMTVPQEEKTLVKNTDTVISPSDTKLEKGGPNQKQTREPNDTEPDDHNLMASNAKYMVIEGPEGQPVKISSKMAMLIDSSETKISSKPVWNKKIDEWKEIMKSNTLAPTPGNFLDIVELTKSVKDNK